MLRGYLIRLTREYTDGGMDSHAEEDKVVTQGKMAVAVIKSIKLFSAQMFAPPSVYCRSIADAHRSCKQALSERSDIVYTLVLCACLFTGEAGLLNPCGSARPLFALF